MATPETQYLYANDDQSEYFSAQESSNACAVFTLDGILRFLQKYWYFVGPAMILIGIFFAFFGFKLFQAALFVIASIAVSGLIMYIMYSTFLQDDSEVWLDWTLLGVSILLGLLAGWMALLLQNIAGAVLAGGAGFFLGVLLNETVVYLAGLAWLYWTVNIGLAVIGFLLGLFFTKHAEVIATSFIGSYMMMKGVGIMAGGFPNVGQLVKMIESGAWDGIPTTFYAYLAGILVLFILTSYFQFRVFFKKEEKVTHPYGQN